MINDFAIVQAHYLFQQSLGIGEEIGSNYRLQTQYTNSS